MIVWRELLAFVMSVNQDWNRAHSCSGMKHQNALLFDANKHSCFGFCSRICFSKFSKKIHIDKQVTFVYVDYYEYYE